MKCPLALFALSMALLLSACGGGGSAASPPAPTPNPSNDTAPLVSQSTWVILGSSSAAGIGPPAGESWAARLEGLVRVQAVEVRNLAQPGLLSSQALPAADVVAAPELPPQPTANIERALSLSPKLVVLAFPSNDAVQGVSAERTAANLRRLRDLARQAGATTLVLSTQPRDGLSAGQQSALSALDDAARSAFGPCFVELQALLNDGGGRIAAAVAAGDGIHLNTEGHRRILEQLRQTLNAGRCVRLASPI